MLLLAGTFLNLGVCGTTPAVEEAQEFIDTVETESPGLREMAVRAFWVQANFVTEITNFLAARAGAEITEKSVMFAKEAAKFNDLKLDPVIKFDHWSSKTGTLYQLYLTVTPMVRGRPSV